MGAKRGVMTPLGKRDRTALMRDTEYFLTEAVSRLERLARHESHDPTIPVWQQSAAMCRRVRGEARRQLDKQRQVDKAAARVERLRAAA
jgi:hypothetical protein